MLQWGIAGVGHGQGRVPAEAPELKDGFIFAVMMKMNVARRRKIQENSNPTVKHYTYIVAKEFQLKCFVTTTKARIA